jgi:hypothetical protein
VSTGRTVRHERDDGRLQLEVKCLIRAKQSATPSDEYDLRAVHCQSDTARWLPVFLRREGENVSAKP